MTQDNPSQAIRVLLVEDSASLRELLSYIVNTDPRLQVIGIADDGEQAVQLAQRLRPDIVLMDIHLPKIDGFAATRRIMEQCPTRIVMITATSVPGEIGATFEALDSGALTVLAKPTGMGHPDHRRLADEMLKTLKLMSEVKVVKRWARHDAPVRLESDLQAADTGEALRVIGIGASTGGPPAVRDILAGLPAGFAAPILIVQHISSGFTDGFVEWLRRASGYDVRVAADGEAARPGVAYVAPEDRHLRMGAGGGISLHADALEHGMRPSVSYLFRSIADTFGAAAAGVLLTGMGVDGAQELLRMRTVGAVTIAQDRESSVVNGMPGEAVRLNAATHILAPEQIAATLVRLVAQRNSDAQHGDRG